MMNSRCFIALLWLALAFPAGKVAAQFVVSDPGPLSSYGGLFHPSSGRINYIYTGPSVILSNLGFQGDLTNLSGFTTTITSAVWYIENQNLGFGLLGVNFATGGTFSGTIPIQGSRPILSWANTGDRFSMVPFHNTSSSITPLTSWSNVSFDFNTIASPISLGSFQLGTSFTFDTFTSDFNTSLGLYGELGNRIAANDHAGAGQQSQIIAGSLPIGTYYLAQSGFAINSQFQYVEGLAYAGPYAGQLNLQLNGDTVFSGAHAGHTFTTFRFSVVPEPTSLWLVGLASLAGFRRRRMV